ncbi:ABC transporter family substrate-binding protein [Streptomyces mangrovisoli]|uniref:Solute-binding protein family 5 domain-containing protein n=1 Tax=Streptomyces mangrovisoli TaxID=1428628 RepID=A0A1J4NR75_9ACTN|nr:ABC transporter family substrate-binding protein [Streptomyces mangrovisoli]OIJ64887.1 hypothetical protein WN71_026700 [Streptomyces mangrovisoli]
MSHDGVGLRAVMRSVAFLTAGALAVPALSGCSSDEEVSKPLAGQQIARADRALIADGGTLRWAVDDVPETLNTFQSDADDATTRVAQAVLPSMFRLDAYGRPQLNTDYLDSAKVVDTEPRQVVVYRLSQQAVWSDGREIGAADFAAQWRALSGKDSAYWTARNAGYDRIQKIERGTNDLEVKVTFSKPYADWRSLFSPLYPKDVMGTADAFNDGARRKLKISAGPFQVKKVAVEDKDVVLTRNPRWWGRPAKLSQIVLHAVAPDQRAEALADGTVDLADVDTADAERIVQAAHPQGTASPSALDGPAGEKSEDSGKTSGEKPGHTSGKKDEHGSGKKDDDGKGRAKADEDDSDGSDDSASDENEDKAGTARSEQQKLSEIQLRKSLEPAYTQLALNGSEGPLADERVRRAVARALDRTALARAVLRPLGLPAVPVGSHLALSGQPLYADASGALGNQDASAAQALLGDAGWVLGGPVKEQKAEEKAAGGKSDGSEESEDGSAGSEHAKTKKKSKKSDDSDEGKSGAGKSAKKDESAGGDDGTYIVGEDDKAPLAPGLRAGEGAGGTRHLAQDGRQYQQLRQGGAPGAYAPKGTAAPAAAANGMLAKDGKALVLRFVVPSGPGSDSLRAVADRISQMLLKVGIRTRITKVPDDSYFKDHVAAGDYDLALYSWPGTAYPATDARPIFAKPVPAADGSLNVEQNYTRVGTDQVDQLFDQALSTLDEGEERSVLRKADSRIWAAAGSIPLYQRPQLVAARRTLANAGAFGFQTPVFEDMGFLKKGAKAQPGPSPK